MSELKVEIGVEPKFVEISVRNQVTVNGKSRITQPQFVANIEYKKFEEMLNAYNSTLDSSEQIKLS